MNIGRTNRLVIAVILCGVAIVGLVISTPFLLVFGMWAPTYSHQSSLFTLPTGEIVSCEGYIEDGFVDYDQHQHVYLQDTATSPRREVGSEIVSFKPYKRVNVEDAKLYRYPEQVILLLSPYIFIQPLDDKKSQWFQSDVMAGGGTDNYLRIFARPGEAAAGEAPHKIGDSLGTNASFFWQSIYVPVRVEDRKLIAERDSNQLEYPRFLAYQLSRSHQWSLDLDATRKMNGWPEPQDPGLTVDFSVLQFPPRIGLSRYSSHEEISAKAGTSEISSASLSLAASASASLKGNSKGQPVPGKTEIRFGFWDIAPGYLSVFLQGNNYDGETYRFVQLDQWNYAGGIDSKEGGCSTFFRVRKP